MGENFSGAKALPFRAFDLSELKLRRSTKRSKHRLDSRIAEPAADDSRERCFLAVEAVPRAGNNFDGALFGRQIGPKPYGHFFGWAVAIFVIAGEDDKKRRFYFSQSARNFARLRVSKNLFFAVRSVQTEKPLRVDRPTPKIRGQQFVRLSFADQFPSDAFSFLAFRLVFVRRAGVVADGTKQDGSGNAPVCAAPAEIVGDFLASGGMADEINAFRAATAKKIHHTLKIIRAIGEDFVGHASLFVSVALLRAGPEFPDAGNAIVTAIAEVKDSGFRRSEWSQIVVMRKGVRAKAVDEGDCRCCAITAEP